MASLPPKAICIPCGREYKAGPGQTGVLIEAFLKNGQPYYKVMGDIWVCPECKHHIVVGFAKSTIEPFDEGYETFSGKFRDVLVTL